MSNKWIGCMVSIECKDDLGIYQGQISAATTKKITLIKSFRNGVPQTETEVVLNAEDIADIKFINCKPETVGQSTVTVAKPLAKRAGRSLSVSECTPNNKSNNTPQYVQLKSSKPVEIDPKPNFSNISNNDYSFKNGTPNKKYTKGWKNEACFGTSMDHSMLQDFDFEKNLALFDKEAIWKKLNASQKQEIVKQTDSVKNSKVQKYRHNENVIKSIPIAFRQILVPEPDSREYVTDDGLVVPSITQHLRRQLFAVAEGRGISVERQTELIGRAATEMALQLLGGGHRLNPHNTHQWPTVVVLCGPHRQGAIGLNCARQLTSHGVNTVVFTVMPDTNGLLRAELNLYRLTKNKLTTSISGLPHTTDLIVLALYNEADRPVNYPNVAEWINQNRAPVLALDPPAMGTPGIVTKFSLVPVLPLSHAPDNGKLYLCNLGFPFKIFKDVGIQYQSPFGPKFVIPLHPNDT